MPKPLLESILHVFNQGIQGTALVGGTALSGFYAGHRRSDDMDLFSQDPPAFRAAVLAVKSLEKTGVVFSEESRSEQYFHALCSRSGHHFTVDVVLDENLFRVGKFELAGPIRIPSLEMLLRMKIATLVSRCGEKDLCDVRWLLEQFSSLRVTDWIELGASIDKGVSAENLLASIAGTRLRKDACGFSLDPKLSKEILFRELQAFQKKLIRLLVDHLKSQPTPPLGKLVKKLK